MTMLRSDVITQNGPKIAFVLIILGVIFAWAWSYFAASSLDPVLVYAEAIRDINEGQKIDEVDIAVVMGRNHQADTELITDPRQTKNMTARIDIRRGAPLKWDALIKARSEISSSEKALKENGFKGKALSSKPSVADQAALSVLFSELKIERAGGKTWFDLADSALELGLRIYTEGTPLNAFFDAFAKEVGKESARDLSAGLRVLAFDAYQRLTTETRDGGRQPYVQTVTLYTTSGNIETAEGVKNLNNLIKIAKKKPSNGGCDFTVTGHADTVGTDVANYDLSKERAQRVGSYLRDRLPTVKISESGWGERHLAVWTQDAQGKQENRRVEVTLNCESAPK